MADLHNGCSGPLSRRSFLQAGMLGLSGLGLSDFLRLRAQANAGSQVPPDTAVILVWLPGGLSHIDTYDMKPNAPQEYPRRVDHQDRSAGPRRLRAAARARQVADRFSIIRSISHSFIQHGGGTKQMLMGRTPLRPEDEGPNEYPSSALWSPRCGKGKPRDCQTMSSAPMRAP